MQLAVYNIFYDNKSYNMYLNKSSNTTFIFCEDDINPIIELDYLIDDHDIEDDNYFKTNGCKIVERLLKLKVFA